MIWDVLLVNRMLFRHWLSVLCGTLVCLDKSETRQTRQRADVVKALDSTWEMSWLNVTQNVTRLFQVLLSKPHSVLQGLESNVLHIQCLALMKEWHAYRSGVPPIWALQVAINIKPSSLTQSLIIKPIHFSAGGLASLKIHRILVVARASLFPVRPCSTYSCEVWISQATSDVHQLQVIIFRSCLLLHADHFYSDLAAAVTLNKPHLVYSGLVRFIFILT
jgi:hypothetical protein